MRTTVPVIMVVTVAFVAMGLVVATMTYAAPTSLLSVSAGSGVSIIPVKSGSGGGGGMGGGGGSGHHHRGFQYDRGFGYGYPLYDNYGTYQDGTKTCVWNGYAWNCYDPANDPNFIR